jgi:hypothetical protein
MLAPRAELADRRARAKNLVCIVKFVGGYENDERELSEWIR